MLRADRVAALSRRNKRRLLGTPRPVKAQAPRDEEISDRADSEPLPSPAAQTEITSTPQSDASPPHPPENRQHPADVLAQTQAARVVEFRHAILVISVLIFIAAIFWAGRKFDRVKYEIMTRVKARALDAGANKFPGVSTEELLDTALAAERRGAWQEATDRFLAAKRQNRALPGILFRIGKSAFDRGDLAGAETALDHAIRFGENLPLANYYRGLIAVRRHELPAATRFFEAAANAEPLVADYYYFWAEALRLDHHPREAVHRYQQAIERTPNPQEATLCQFKIRLARVESVEGEKIRAELEEARSAGPLSIDWLMTDAALQLQAGKFAEAAQLITQARDQGLTGLFVTCAGDTLFRQAGENHPEIASLIGPAVTPPE